MVRMKMKIPIPKTNQFTISQWTGAGEGEKILLYAITGMGKTTLASLAPDPVFIGADDGGRKIRHPVTGEPLAVVPGVSDFKTLRDVLHSNVFEQCKTLVVDTITQVERWALDYTLQTVSKPKSQGGGPAKDIHDYGYHEGFHHWAETMQLLLPDFDAWVRRGKNILLLAQETTHKWKTSGPEDFLMAGPDLQHSRTASTLLPYMNWCDHILRIGYANTIVAKGKVNAATTRAIYVQPDATFFAKSRTIPMKYDVVEFKEPKDDSIWRLIWPT